MCNTNPGKKIAFLVAVLLAVAIFASLAAPASADGTPYRLIVFTDKKVYMDDPYSIAAAEKWWTTDFYPYHTIKIHAIVLDQDGKIMKSGVAFNASIKDIQRWIPGKSSSVEDHHYINYTNGWYYNVNIPSANFTDPDADGIFTATQSIRTWHNVNTTLGRNDQILLNITVNETNSGSQSVSQVILSAFGCGHGDKSGMRDHAHKEAPCVVCHWGYEQTLGVHGNNTPLANDPALSYGSKTFTSAGNWEYKTGYESGSAGTTWTDAGRSDLCVACHSVDSATGAIAASAPDPLLDMGLTGTDPADTNVDGINDAGDRPSCGWGQGAKGDDGSLAAAGCHAAGTSIEQAPLKDATAYLVDLKWKQSSGLGNYSHNNTRDRGIPCSVCHGGVHEVKASPNSSETTLTTTCNYCHNSSDGWINISSPIRHTSGKECKNCHVENNKLDTHLMPTGVFGGRWCLNCHNLTGNSPINMKVDPAIANISNINYTHYDLNKNSDATNSSRICWGCHTNNSYVINGRVNSTSLPAADHPTGYDAPRNCTACHYNTSAYNFSAPQNYRHTWYAPNMITKAVNSCSDCHARDEMLNAWNEAVYPPKNDSEASSHYGKNRTSFFQNLITTGKYCQYCHQNESTVMGPFANPDNEVRSDHASQITTPSCENSTCHKDGRLHDDTIVVPTYNESNINTTCLSCHSNTSYNAHNSTITCWDCHMGNVTNTVATWIHPIQFIQYNGNFTGAKLTGATCYDCHKSSSVDNTTQYLSGKKAPKVYNQAHSNDPNNGTKWGDYWKYTPTAYEFATYSIIGGNGTIDPAHPFSNIEEPSNEYMQLNETKTGSGNGSTVPINKKEQKIEGPPVPNWTSSTATGGTTSGVTISADQDSTKGNPAGSLKASMKTGSGNGDYLGYAWWNYSFYYKPNATNGYAFTNASVDYNVTVPGSTKVQKVYLRLVKPSGAIVNLSANDSITANTGWRNLSNNSFASAFTEDGSVTPYKLQLYTEFVGVKTSLTYTVNYDNILLKFQEKVWNRYEIVINTTGVPVNGSSMLGMSYQVHRENTSLRIYNRTSGAYELLDTMDKGVFYDYTRNISSTHHILPIGDGTTGNVSVKFVDDDQSDTDAVSDVLHIRYLYVYTDRGLQYPCEQCHSPNKHYVNPTLGSPDKFNASNKVNQTISSTSTWCQQCHWEGAANYSRMILEYNITRNPPENIPPEITGNKTYGNFTTSKDGKTSYVNHTGSSYSDMSDLGCFSCHGKSGDTTTSQFVHNVQVGAGGNRQCITCHNTSASNTKYKKIDVDALRNGMHANLKNASANVSNASNPIELACWACHGDGLYNNPDDHHSGTKTCDKCHTNTTGKLNYSNATRIYEHIPANLITPEANITANSTASWSCADCHNNSINTTALTNDNEPDPINARTGHYGLNSTGGKLMYSSTASRGNSEDCTYCHNGNSANMTKWGINTSTTKNLSNKGSHSSYTNTQCGSCHNYTDSSAFTFHAEEMNQGAGSGPDCKSCHNISAGGSDKGHIDYPAFNTSIHGGINTTAGASNDPDNEPCWACHGSGNSEGHNTTGDAYGKGNYTNPYVCADCHASTGVRYAWATGKGALNVSEHFTNGTKIKASYNATVTFSCLKCHQDFGEMLLPNGDTDYNKTAWAQGGDNYNATIGGNNSPYHYGAKRTTLNGSTQNTDGYCNYCHSNSSSIFPYVNQHNKSIFEHTANASADIKNTTSLNCNNTVCHGTGRIHNATLTKPVVQIWTSGKFDYCAPCHKAGNANATKYVYGHNSSNISAVSTDCGYCHNSSSQGQPGGTLKIHTPTLTNRSVTNTSCVTCHQNATYVSAQRVINTHYPEAPAGKANTSQDSFTCETCHGNMPANKMHAPVNIPSDRCNNCHNGTVSGTYKATKIPYVNATRHDNSSHNVSNNINCDWCHNNSNAIQKFHFTQYPNGTVQAPGWTGWSNGTNTNCTNCHDTYNQTKPFYAEPIWHKGNYGTTADNCYQCHTSASSSTGGSAPVALHNVTKAIDWSYCNNCHSNNYGGAPIVDNASLSNSMHYNLNGATPSNTEPACKACHGGNSTLHKNASANNCTYCHITGSLKYTTKNVSRHIPYPYTSDVNTSRYQYVFCSDCHNNSLRAYSDPTPSTNNATTSHYGMNKTGSKLMYNSSGNTEDCIYCHRNNSNMAAWGILGTSKANLSNKGGNHATAANSDCYTCHVNSTSAPVTFHVEDVSAGAGGGPDCKACHNFGGNAQGKIVNFSAMNDSLAIHKNLNSGATAVVDAENKKCWACHTTNGTAPQAGNHTLVDRYKNPYNCTDCHISKAGQNFNYTPINTLLNVTQHKADTQNGTTIFTPSAGDCYSCHNKSEMMVAANDPDSGTGDVYGGLHGGNDSVSHYGLKRSLGSGDAYCNYCHSNASSMFPFANQHSKSIFEHTANGTADIRNTTTLECLDCHTSDLQSYRIHNSTLKTPTTSVWTSGKQDRCAPCHKTAGSGSSLQVNNSYHNTTTGGITDCGYCHNDDAMRAGNAPQNIHSDNLTGGGNSTYNNCYNCHQNGFASKVIIEHTNNTGANITNASMTCSKGGCHVSNKTHSSALVKPATNTWTAGGNDYCAPCHNSSDSVNNATKKVYNQGHNPTNNTNDNITSCGNCHNASTPGAIPSSFRMHDTSMTKSPVEPNASTCQGCHNGTSLFVGAGRQIFSHIPNASQYRGNTSTSSYTCEYCHNMSDKPSMHSADMTRSNGTCETCHYNNTSPFKSTQKNVTQLAGGMLSHSYNGSVNTTCKMCHNASGRVKFHLSKYASGDIADPQDSYGMPTFINRSDWNSEDVNNRGILVDCRDCHEKYNDTAPFNASFFEANRTGVNLQEHVGKGYTLKNCYICHTNETNSLSGETVIKPAGLHNVSIEPLTGGPNCTKCHNIGSTDSGKAPDSMLVNFTAFNSTASKHRNLTNATAWGGSSAFGLIDTACWACHQSNGKQPERHPDLKDDTTLTGGSKAYRCEDCHTVDGVVSINQPAIYMNATKVYKHYPGAVLSGQKAHSTNFTAGSCQVCHNKSIETKNNITAGINATVSHYATKSDLVVTNLDYSCEGCHVDSGATWGAPKQLVDKGRHSKQRACQSSCHNPYYVSNASINPIKLHNASLGIYYDCYKSDCHAMVVRVPRGVRR